MVKLYRGESVKSIKRGGEGLNQYSGGSVKSIQRGRG